MPAVPAMAPLAMALLAAIEFHPGSTCPATGKAVLRSQASMGTASRVLVVQPEATSTLLSKRGSEAQSVMLTALLVTAHSPAMPRPRGSSRSAPPSSSDRQKTSFRRVWWGVFGVCTLRSAHGMHMACT